MQRIRFSLLLFISLVAFVCGCSGGFNGREWKIAIDESWYPLNLMGRDKQVIGFTTDLLQEVSALQRIRIVRVQENWNNLLSHLQQKQYEGMLSSMYPYTFYEKQYDFSKPFLLTGPVLVLPFSSKETSLKAFSGKEIAVVTGSHNSLIVEKYPGVIIRNYESIPDAFNDIVAGVIDGAVVDVLPATAYCQDLFQNQLKVASAPMNDQGLRLVTLHDQSPELIESFNSALEKLRASGKYAELSRKWGLPPQ
ncbi:MAG: amino acid ABC transporter substrate-binding protein [Chlamydiales bacterium]|nr:amino acid ABC transporter substrate-binding protein [Chlamydiales bacterium]